VLCNRHTNLILEMKKLTNLIQVDEEIIKRMKGREE
jgi:hypothetical protein